MATVQRVQTIGTGVAGAPFYTNLYFEGGIWSPTAMRDRVADAWDQLTNYLNNGATFTVQGLIPEYDVATGQTVGQEVVANALPVSGASTEPGMAYHTQGLVQWRTGVFVLGRELRGRSYIPALTEAANSDGAPVGGFTSALNDFVDALTTSAQPQISVYSRTHGDARTVTGGAPWNQFAYMASRRP